MIDPTIVRAHQHAAGARKLKEGLTPRVWPVLRRIEHKMHAAGDAVSIPICLIASPGRRIDIAFAHDLVDGFEAGATRADKGYDADHFCEAIAQTGAEVAIPPKRDRNSERDYDVELYKERNIIERFFNKLKQFRRVVIRYEKLLANFMGFVKLAAIAIWFK